MGEVKVIVDAGTTVVVEGSGVMGEYAEQRPKVPFDPERGGPLLRVKRHRADGLGQRAAQGRARARASAGGSAGPVRDLFTRATAARRGLSSDFALISSRRSGH